MSATLEVCDSAPTPHTVLPGEWLQYSFTSPLLLASPLLSSSLLSYPLLSSFSPTLALNTGHYTAYSKHPATQEWSYYNDETVTKVRTAFVYFRLCIDSIAAMLSMVCVP